MRTFPTDGDFDDLCHVVFESGGAAPILIVPAWLFCGRLPLREGRGRYRDGAHRRGLREVSLELLEGCAAISFILLPFVVLYIHLNYS